MLRRSLGPWLAGALLALVASARPLLAGPACSALLAGNVYRCTVRTSFDSRFQDCYRFTAPGTRSVQLDLAADGVDEPFGCACAPTGRAKRPKFDRSRAFTCTGGGTTGLVDLTLEGTVVAKGKRIKGGRGVTDAGDSFVFECVRDAGCTIP